MQRQESIVQVKIVSLCHVWPDLVTRERERLVPCQLEQDCCCFISTVPVVSTAMTVKGTLHMYDIVLFITPSLCVLPPRPSLSYYKYTILRCNRLVPNFSPPGDAWGATQRVETGASSPICHECLAWSLWIHLLRDGMMFAKRNKLTFETWTGLQIFSRVFSAWLGWVKFLGSVFQSCQGHDEMTRHIK